MSSDDYTQKNSSIVKLDEPLARGDTIISEIEVIKPTAGHLRGVKLSDVLQLDVDAIIKIAPRVTSPALSAADMQKMDPADLVQIGGKIATFFVRRADRDETE